MSASTYIQADTTVVETIIATYGVEILLAGDVTVDLESTTAQTLYTAPDDGNNRFVTKVVLRNPDAPLGQIGTVSIGSSGSLYTAGDILTLQDGGNDGTVTVETVTPKVPDYSNFVPFAVVAADALSGITAYGGFIYAINSSGYIEKFDASDIAAGPVGTGSDTFPVGSTITTLDGSVLWIAGGGTVWRRDAAFPDPIATTISHDYSGYNYVSGDSRAIVVDSNFVYIYFKEGNVIRALNTDLSWAGTPRMSSYIGNPYATGFVATTHRAYTLSFAGHIGEYDLDAFSDAPQTPLRTVETGNAGLEISTDGTYLFVSSGDYIRVYAISDFSLVTTFGGSGSGPGKFNVPGYSVSSNEKLFIADTGNSRISEWSPGISGGEILTISAPTTKGTGYQVASGLATTVSPFGGTGATIDIDSILSITGTINDVSLGAAGIGYSAGDVLTLEQSGASGGTVTVGTATAIGPSVAYRDSILSTADICPVDLALGESNTSIFMKDGNSSRIKKVNIGTLAITDGPVTNGYKNAVAADNNYLFYSLWDNDNYNGYLYRCDVNFANPILPLKIFSGTGWWDYPQMWLSLASDGTYLYVHGKGTRVLERRLQSNLKVDISVSGVPACGEYGGMVVSGGYLYIAFGESYIIKKYSCADLSEITGAGNSYSWASEAQPKSPVYLSTDGINLVVTLADISAQNKVKCVVLKLADLSQYTPELQFGSFGSGAEKFSFDSPTVIYDDVVYTGDAPAGTGAKPIQRWDISNGGGVIQSISLTTKGSDYSVASGVLTNVSPEGGTGATIDIDSINLQATGTFGSDVLATNWGSFSLVGMTSVGNCFGSYMPSLIGDSVCLEPDGTFNLIVNNVSSGVTCSADLFGFLSRILVLDYNYIYNSKSSNAGGQLFGLALDSNYAYTMDQSAHICKYSRTDLAAASAVSIESWAGGYWFSAPADLATDGTTIWMYLGRTVYRRKCLDFSPSDGVHELDVMPSGTERQGINDVMYLDGYVYASTNVGNILTLNKDTLVTVKTSSVSYTGPLFGFGGYLYVYGNDTKIRKYALPLGDSPVAVATTDALSGLGSFSTNGDKFFCVKYGQGGVLIYNCSDLSNTGASFSHFGSGDTGILYPQGTVVDKNSVYVNDSYGQYLKLWKCSYV